MNKKTLFLILLVIIFVLPISAHADQFCDAVKNIESIIWRIGGSMVVIGWVTAGILYLTAAGGERMGIAKKALIAAVIGTVLVVISASMSGIIIDALDFEGIQGSCSTK